MTSSPRGFYFEDIEVGQTYVSPGLTVTQDSIIRFALEWDMQPFHVDVEAARSSVFGTLTGSGLQTVLLTYRLYHQMALFDRTALAGLGFDGVRFITPLVPDVTIAVTARIKALRETKRPDRGLVVVHLETRDQHSREILAMDLSLLLSRRPSGLL